ncbi:hypothetical protein H0G86_009126 [Trichoderma simmonsii]|uniref:Uncharacterized protein n=1 Tax=Trichoderma simmonsii TaxID=1491479 RepID=A0A8G0PK08_9HYPO|nr:hypothetical protein H0G86_009126 [Trichoderma simmonsii]
MDSRDPRQDASQLPTTPSSNFKNFKRAGSGSRSTSQLHKARGITEVWNRNTISKDSTQSNELCALALRNRNTISKDLTQSDKPFEYRQMRSGSLAIPPSASPGLYAVHQPNPAQQQQMLQQQQQQQQMVAAAVPNGNFNGIDIVAQSAGMTPQRQQQMLHHLQREMMLQRHQQQQQQQQEMVAAALQKAKLNGGSIASKGAGMTPQQQQRMIQGMQRRLM